MPEENPIIALDSEGQSILIRRDLSEPVNYRGRNFIELDFEEPAEELFEEVAFETPEGRGEDLSERDLEKLREEVKEGRRSGIASKLVLSGKRATLQTLAFPETPGAEGGAAGGASAGEPPAGGAAAVDPDLGARILHQGKRMYFYRGLDGSDRYRLQDEPREPEPRLYLVETYQLSTRLGQYGAGRVVKTFSLLPGESTRISVRSFLKSESQRKQATSILDSVSEESASDFQSTLETEQSDKRGYQKTFEYELEAEASVSWGFGGAKLTTGLKQSSNAAREEFSKNVGKATEQHAAKASAKRDVEINTSYEVTETSEDETSIEREVQNVNVSRTLNFVFRQMNQEFFSVLHLIDVRVAFFNGFGESRREVPLHDLDSLLAEVVREPHRAAVKRAIEGSLAAIADFEGRVHADFVTEREIDGERYPRVNRELVSSYRDPLTGTELQVQGVITNVIRNVMRTEGVIVESLLGEASALDTYSKQLQLEAARERRLANDRREAERDRLRLGLAIVEAKDEEAARVFAAVFPAVPEKEARGGEREGPPSPESPE